MRVLTSDSPQALANTALLRAPALGHSHGLAERSGARDGEGDQPIGTPLPPVLRTLIDIGEHLEVALVTRLVNGALFERLLDLAFGFVRVRARLETAIVH